jgi:hypothetical protein
VILLLTHAEQLYRSAGDEGRLLNKAVFEPFAVDSHPDSLTGCTLAPDAPLTPVIEAVLAQRATNARTLGERKLAEGSNLTQLAVSEGFEPSVDLHPQTLSRRSP